nr:hypothetical protein Iba_chr02aCG8600 [Ipomoea batatas]
MEDWHQKVETKGPPGWLAKTAAEYHQNGTPAMPHTPAGLAHQELASISSKLHINNRPPLLGGSTKSTSNLFANTKWAATSKERSTRIEYSVLEHRWRTWVLLCNCFSFLFTVYHGTAPPANNSSKDYPPAGGAGVSHIGKATQREPSFHPVQHWNFSEAIHGLRSRRDCWPVSPHRDPELSIVLLQAVWHYPGGTTPSTALESDAPADAAWPVASQGLVSRPPQ